MNTELLLKVKAKILAEPESFDMAYFCGTPCCIAGHVLSIQGVEAPLSLISEQAQAFLDLDDGQELRLFYHENWPLEFCESFPPRSKERAQIAADRIEHFIATGGRE